MQTRQFYLNLLHQHVKSPRLIAHSLAAEAVMRALARRLGEDEEQWAAAGLLHDLDVEITADDFSRHGLASLDLLKDAGLPPEILDAITMHNEAAAGKKRSTRLQHALAAAETITGLIFATALVYPDKKIASVKPKSIVKRMKEKAFAASVSRDNIRECEAIGVPLNEFAELALQALVPIAGELGF